MAVSSDERNTPDRDEHRHERFHVLKGRIVHRLGVATADRHVEAKGAAEMMTGHRPTPQEVDEAEHVVKASYGEAGET